MRATLTQGGESFPYHRQDRGYARSLQKLASPSRLPPNSMTETGPSTGIDGGAIPAYDRFFRLY